MEAHWQSDEDALNCQSCGSPFSLLRRRHHCRDCGGIFCRACVPHTVKLPYRGYKNKQKDALVCSVCVTFLKMYNEVYGSDVSGATVSPELSSVDRRRAGGGRSSAVLWHEEANYTRGFIRPSSVSIRRGRNGSRDDMSNASLSMGHTPHCLEQDDARNLQLMPNLRPFPIPKLALTSVAEMLSQTPSTVSIETRELQAALEAALKQELDRSVETELVVVDFASYY